MKQWQVVLLAVIIVAWMAVSMPVGAGRALGTFQSPVSPIPTPWVVNLTPVIAITPGPVHPSVGGGGSGTGSGASTVAPQSSDPETIYLPQSGGELVYGGVLLFVILGGISLFVIGRARKRIE